MPTGKLQIVPLGGLGEFGMNCMAVRWGDGIIVTHGHEDHIGALPWMLSELNVPVWGTEFTLAYVEEKLDEHGLLDDADLREMRPNERFKAGACTIPPIHVTHSLVDCVSLAIHTPL